MWFGMLDRNVWSRMFLSCGIGELELDVVVGIEGEVLRGGELFMGKGIWLFGGWFGDC